MKNFLEERPASKTYSKIRVFLLKENQFPYEGYEPI